MKKPTPFDESKDPNPFWRKGPTSYVDPAEAVMPTPGFLSDLAYYWRGTEVPLLYTIWAGLASISSVIKREAWLDWYPDPLFANLYVILVGPAGGRKTTMVSAAHRLIKNFHLEIKDPNLRQLKRLRILKDKGSPEFLLLTLSPDNAFIFKDPKGQPLTDSSGKVIKYQGDSALTICLEEMSTMINKQRYNESMIENLLALYDCSDTWEWGTKGEGKKTFRNLYTTFLAATTPSGFRNSIPKAAIGDGFLSRSIVAYSGMNTDRAIWKPVRPDGAPTKEELCKRLAYIAQAVQGEYHLTDEAEAFGRDWYRTFKRELKTKLEDLGIWSRLDTNLRKVALLLKAQEYPDPSDREITVDHLKMADALLRYTYLTNKGILTEIKADDGTQDIAQVRNYLMERHDVTRGALLAGTRIKADRLNDILNHLVCEGCLKIFYDGEEFERTTRKTGETYEFIHTDTFLNQDDELKQGNI